MSANGDTNANLACALGYRDQHNIHYADAAYQEGDRRHAHEQERQRLLDALHGLEDLRLILNAEIVLLWSSDLVPLLQHLLTPVLPIIDLCRLIREHSISIH